VVVSDFDLAGIAVLPTKADPILVIDANTVLAFSVPLERLEMIARGDRQLTEFAHSVQLV
jgi:hypothetical protein